MLECARNWRARESARARSFFLPRSREERRREGRDVARPTDARKVRPTYEYRIPITTYCTCLRRASCAPSLAVAAAVVVAVAAVFTVTVAVVLSTVGNGKKGGKRMPAATSHAPLISIIPQTRTHIHTVIESCTSCLPPFFPGIFLQSLFLPLPLMASSIRLFSVE